MISPQAAAADLDRYEDLIRRFQREYEEIQGYGEDLLHHQQELQRHGQFLLRLHEDSRRHAESVRRLYEDNQNHASRLRSMEGMVRALFNNSLKSIGETLKSGDRDGDGVHMAIEEGRDEKNKGAKSSETDETEDDLIIKEKFDDGVDSYAAKTLIDLALFEDMRNSSSLGQGSIVRNVGGSARMKEKEEELDIDQYRNRDRYRDMEIEILKGKEIVNDAEASQVNLDLGCRFHPTDQELIACLERKVAGESTPSYIREKNLYGTEEPQDIFRANSAIELYFFTLIKKKYDQGKKIDRVVGKGTWKIQSTKDIYDDPQNKTRIIGFKRTLNFVEDLSSQTRKSKNSWIMHEFILNAPSPVNDDQGRWAICRIKRGRGNRIGLPPTSSFSPINISLKRPAEYNVTHESQMPDTKLAKTSNVLLLTSSSASILPEEKTVSILPEEKTTVTAATKNVELPQQDRGQDQRLPSSLRKASAEVTCEALEQAHAEVICVALEQASAEVMCEVLEQASAEVMCKALEQASAEVMREKLEQAPADVMCEKLEQAPAELMCEKLEQAPAKMMCKELEQVPAKMMCEELQQLPAEVLCEKLDQLPAEVLCEKLEQAPAEVMCEKLEQVLSEDLCEISEQAPAELMCENVEQVPAKMMCEELEQVPADVRCEKLERIPAVVLFEKLEQAPAEVMCEKLERASAEAICEELEQVSADVISEELDEVPDESTCVRLDGKEESENIIVYKRRPKKESNGKGSTSKDTSNVEVKIITSPKKTRESLRKSSRWKFDEGQEEARNYKLISDLY